MCCIYADISVALDIFSNCIARRTNSNTFLEAQTLATIPGYHRERRSDRQIANQHGARTPKSYLHWMHLVDRVRNVLPEAALPSANEAERGSIRDDSYASVLHVTHSIQGDLQGRRQSAPHQRRNCHPSVRKSADGWIQRPGATNGLSAEDQLPGHTALVNRRNTK